MATIYEERRERNTWRFENADVPGLDENNHGEPVEPEIEDNSKARERVFSAILDQLAVAELTCGDLVEWISDPNSSCPAENRYNGFFAAKDQVKRVLGHWSSWKNCSSGQALLRDWTLAFVSRRITKEGNKATESKLLQSRTMAIDRTFVLKFDIMRLYKELRELCQCPTTLQLFHALCTTRKQERKMKDSSKMTLRKQLVSIPFKFLSLLITHRQIL